MRAASSPTSCPTVNHGSVARTVGNPKALHQRNLALTTRSAEFVRRLRSGLFLAGEPASRYSSGAFNRSVIRQSQDFSVSSRGELASIRVDYYLTLSSHGGILKRQPVIQLRAERPRWCEDFWTKHKLNRASRACDRSRKRSARKELAGGIFLRVVNWWRTATGGHVVLPMGPVEEERGGVDRLSRHCVTVSGLRLSQLAALIAGSDLYLGNDSGVSHLAAAVSVRTVALFGPSDT